MAETDPTSTILPLLHWLSPAFPVGAYAYSHGLEWAVEAGDVRDEPGLQDWIATVLEHGAGRSDAILLACAFRAAGDDEALREINDYALAFAPSAELRLETAQQGKSFLAASAAGWPSPALSRAAARADEIAYPVAVGLAAQSHRLDLRLTLQAYLAVFVQNWVSAGIRLAPIGQTAGLRIISALTPLIVGLAENVLPLGIEDVGGMTFRADLGSFRHETQYTRLFRS